MAEELSRPADVETLTTGVRWRWGIVCVGTVLLAIGSTLGVSELPALIVASFATVGVVANLSLLRLLSLQWYRPWLIYAYCLLDMSLIGIAIVYLGPGGAIAGFFLVIVPCASRTSRALGIFALVAAAGVFLAASTLHGLLVGSDSGSAPKLLLDLTLFVSVAATLLATHTDLFGRIATLQSVMSRAKDGSLDRPTFAIRDDRLGLVEQSLNDVLEQIASLIAAVKREADELAVLGSSVARSTSIAAESSERFVSLTAGLSTELLNLKSSAEAGQLECKDAAQEAQHLQSRADGGAGNVRELEETADLGRDGIARAIETVLAIGADIERTARIVDELSGLSRQIGSSALSISKIARHTHVIALNAAIEAARAEEHGDEFAVVADQVRTLAGEAGRSARDVGDLVSEVNAGIAAAASALAASETKVNEVSQVAGEARTALVNIRSGSATAADFVAATTETSQSQANYVRSFADMMSQLMSESTRWCTEVQAASSSASEQCSLMGDLDRTCEQLNDVAERLKLELTRFSTPRP